MDETYERILDNINDEYTQEARRLLVFLCFASRPLTASELIHALAVMLHNQEGFDQSRCLQDVTDLLRLCPGLIIAIPQVGSAVRQISPSPSSILRIAHSSVEDYLRSDRVHQQKAAAFALNSASANAEIAQVCLLYLRNTELTSGIVTREKLSSFPLAKYATKFWHKHYQLAARSELGLEVDNAAKLFFDDRNAVCTWVRIQDPHEQRWILSDYQRPESCVPSSIYCASLLGLDSVLIQLITELRQNVSNLDFQNIMNDVYGVYGSALSAAAANGFENAITLLCESGANVNVNIGHMKTPLHWAAQDGHFNVVNRLLAYGANPNARDDNNFSPIMLAAEYEQLETFTKLLDTSGIDLTGNFQGTLREILLHNDYHKRLLASFFRCLSGEHLLRTPYENIGCPVCQDKRSVCLHQESKRVLEAYRDTYLSLSSEDEEIKGSITAWIDHTRILTGLRGIQAEGWTEEHLQQYQALWFETRAGQKTMVQVSTTKFRNPLAENPQNDEGFTVMCSNRDYCSKCLLPS